MRLVALLALLPFAALAQPETPGPHETQVWEAGLVQAAGTPINTRVYFAPDAPGPRPVVAVVHGWLRNGGYMRDLATVLASRGFVAVVPDMPCGALGCDHDANAAQISALLDWAAAPPEGAPIAGRIDDARRGVIGHSWGGLAAFLASGRDARLRSAVFLDPNDDGGVAHRAAPMMAVPAAYLMAENPGACNSQWRDETAALTSASRLQVTVRGSGHCDPESPTDGLCPIACGAGNAATTPLFHRYAVAWTACLLDGDASMAEWLGGAGLDGDVDADRLGDVSAEGLDALPCRAGAPAPDAGRPTDAAPPADAALPADAAPCGSGTEPRPGGGCGPSAPDAAPADAAPRADATQVPDAAALSDAAPDAAAPQDGASDDGGCAATPLGAPALLGLLLLRRRRLRSPVAPRQ